MSLISSLSSSISILSNDSLYFLFSSVLIEVTENNGSSYIESGSARKYLETIPDSCQSFSTISILAILINCDVVSVDSNLSEPSVWLEASL